MCSLPRCREKRWAWRSRLTTVPGAQPRLRSARCWHSWAADQGIDGRVPEPDGGDGENDDNAAADQESTFHAECPWWRYTVSEIAVVLTAHPRPPQGVSSRPALPPHSSKGISVSDGSPKTGIKREHGVVPRPGKGIGNQVRGCPRNCKRRVRAQSMATGQPGRPGKGDDPQARRPAVGRRRPPVSGALIRDGFPLAVTQGFLR